jgi:hypothetical protein
MSPRSIWLSRRNACDPAAAGDEVRNELVGGLALCGLEETVPDVMMAARKRARQFRDLKSLSYTQGLKNEKARSFCGLVCFFEFNFMASKVIAARARTLRRSPRRR